MRTGPHAPVQSETTRGILSACVQTAVGPTADIYFSSIRVVAQLGMHGKLRVATCGGKSALQIGSFESEPCRLAWGESGMAEGDVNLCKPLENGIPFVLAKNVSSNCMNR